MRRLIRLLFKIGDLVTAGEGESILFLLLGAVVQPLQWQPIMEINIVLCFHQVVLALFDAYKLAIKNETTSHSHR